MIGRYQYDIAVLTFSRGLTTANKNPPFMEFSLKVTTIANSAYSFSGKNNRYGDLISDPGLMPNAGNPSSPLSKYSIGSSNGTLMAVCRSCSPEKIPSENNHDNRTFMECPRIEETERQVRSIKTKIVSFLGSYTNSSRSITWEFSP